MCATVRPFVPSSAHQVRTFLSLCSVCLVLEICEYGSLSDVLRGGDGTAGQGRSPLNLSYSDRMFLALGCARGLQALHSYSPLLCHRDIKSMNFLSESRAVALLFTCGLELMRCCAFSLLQLTRSLMRRSRTWTWATSTRKTPTLLSQEVCASELRWGYEARLLVTNFFCPSVLTAT